MKGSIFLLLSMAGVFGLYAQPPVINQVTAPGTVLQYERIELQLSLTATYSNPYDYDQVVTGAIFQSPSGKRDTVDGFFMQDFLLQASSGSLTTQGTGGFRIRYTPAENGTYSYTVYCQTPAGQDITSPRNITVNTSARPGFIRLSTTPYLQYDNGEQYIPVGQNQAWQQSNKYLDFKSWNARLAEQGANFIRLWQCSWGLGIEWQGGGYEGLKRYRQDNSFYTDLLLEDCSRLGIAVMFCINHHGMVSTQVNPNWSDNPYNAALGGPCASTWDFFTNNVARSLHKNRLRYIIARWGFSTAVMSWELFNEVDWTDQFDTRRQSVKNWHQEMARFIKSKDPFRHPVTTSFGNAGNDADTWNLPEMDFTQTHYYVGSPNLESVLAEGSRDYLTRFGKPTYNGEFGIESANIDLSAVDPNGIYIHNSIWGTLFSGGMGAGSSWWWDNYIDPRQLYFHYKGPSSMTHRIRFLRNHFTPHTGEISGTAPSDFSISPGADWGMAPASNFTISNGQLSPSASALGKYLYGNTWNTSLRNPPTFQVTVPANSQLRIQTGATGTSPRLNVYLNGTQIFNQSVSAQTTYTINLPAGSHAIKVDNLGTDWVQIASFTFTQIGTPLNTYLLRSQQQNQVTGWVHNKRYNWQEVRTAGVPAAVSGATLTIPGMINGSYQVIWYDCISGAELQRSTVVAAGSQLSLPVPSIGWDAAFTAYEWNSIGITGTPPSPGAGTADVVWQVLPNPAGAGPVRLNVTGLQPGPYRLQILSSGGQILLTQEINAVATGLQTAINLDRYPAATYLCCLTDAQGRGAGCTRIVKH